MDTPEAPEPADDAGTDEAAADPTVESTPAERSVPGWAVGLYVLAALAIGLQLAIGWVLLDTADDVSAVADQSNDLVIAVADVRSDVAAVSGELDALDQRVTNAQSVSVVDGAEAPGAGALPLIPSSGSDPAVGMQLPTITGLDHDTGEELTIGAGDLATITIVWAHWCPYCQQELPMVDGLIKDGSLDEFDAVQVQSITTFIDEGRPNPLGPYMAELGLSYPAVVDETGEFAAQLGVSGVPAWVITDRDGAVLGRFSGAIGEEAFLGVMAEVQRLATEG